MKLVFVKAKSDGKTTIKLRKICRNIFSYHFYVHTITLNKKITIKYIY